MYNTDFIVRYHEIEYELIRRLEVRLASEAAAEITAAIQAVFRNAGEHSNENIIINVEVGGSGDSDDENGRRGHRIEVVNSNRNKKSETIKAEEQEVLEEQVEEAQVEEDEQSEPVSKALEEEEEQEEEEEEGEEPQVLEEGEGEGQEEEDDGDENYKYNRKDVTYICEKLYRDELLSAFCAESIDDPKMDKGIQAIFEALINNDEFKQFLTEMNALLLDTSKATTEQELANLKRNTDYLIFITLFSQQLFYLTHRCLCQMLSQGKVQPEMMDQLKQRSMKIFQLSGK